jgi:hypothetical protein
MLFYVVFSVDTVPGRCPARFAPGKNWFKFQEGDGHAAFSAELTTSQFKEFVTRMNLFRVTSIDKWTVSLSWKERTASLAAYVTPLPGWKTSLLTERNRLRCMKTLEGWLRKPPRSYLRQLSLARIG